MKRKLLFTIVALLCSVGIQKINAAYTDYLTSGNGWTQVTSASGIVTDGSCTYVIVAKDFDLVVGIPSEGSDGQLTYQTLSGQPARKQAWLIEADSYGSGGYALKNFARTGYYLTAVGGDTGAWNLVARASDKNTANTCYQFTFDGSGNLLIQTNSDVNSDNADRYWGDWTVGNHSNGNTLAGNKTDANKVTFQLFKKNDVSALVYNNGFEGTYTQKYTINTNRYVFQPDGWDIDYKNVSTWNMTVVSSADDMASNFTGTYAVTAGNNKYMVRLRDNETSEYVDLSQSITIPNAGLYLLSADLIRENSSKAIVKLYAGDQAVQNSKDGAWETRSLLLNVTAGQTIKIGIKYENKGAGGHKAGADNIKLQKLGNAPVDVTALVANPNFDSNIDSWTAPSGGAKLCTNEKTDQTTNFYETWNSDPKQGRMYQVIEGLPQGTYKLKVFAFADQNGTMTPANTDVCVYAQGQEVGTSSSSHVHRNYVNSTDFAYYQTYAYVNATGKLEIGMRQDVANFRWLGMDNVTLEYVGTADQEDALLLAELQTKWSNVNTAISTAQSGTYSNVTGSEGTALTSALGQSISAISDYATYATLLQTAYINVINAKSAYDTFDTEKDNALLMGVNGNDVVRPTSGSAGDLLTAMRGLYELEDAAATSGYTVDATTIFGSWVEQNTGSNSGQHWSGDSRSYIDQNSGSGYTMSVTNTVTLPAGHYVFKAAARAAADGVNGAFNMSVKIGSADAVYKHYNAQGDSGKGIDTFGAANYGEGTFCNNGSGRGWEWRLFAFDLEENTEVTMKVYAQIFGGKWVSFSDITLLTTDDNLTICQTMWTNAKTAAEAARDNSSYSNITGKEKTDLLSAIAATATEPNTASGYKTQESALLAATSAFTAAKDAYDEYAQESVVATALGVDVPAINSSTTTATTLISNMQTMNVSDYSEATTNYTFNATSMLGAWTSAPGTNKGQSWDGTTGNDGDIYYDEYNGSARSMTQTVTLPKAKYVLIAKGRASTDGRLTLSDGTNTITFPHKSSTGKGVETDGTPNFGDGTYANSSNGWGWEYRFLPFESDGSASTTLTFNWTTASNNWAGLDDITLLAIPESVELNEEDEYEPVFTLADVTLTRSIAADTWSTFVVPFDIDNTTLKAQFGDDVRVSEFSAEDKTGVKFTPMETPAITANKPVLVRVSSLKSSFTFDGVEIKVATPTFSQAGVNFVGNYGGEITIPANAYYVKSNIIKKSNGSQKLKGFRAYFTVDADSSVKAFFENDIFIDDEATGIVNLNDNLNKNEAIYNLAGQRVQKAQKGLYIVNGRKVVVK